MQAYISKFTFQALSEFRDTGNSNSSDITYLKIKKSKDHPTPRCAEYIFLSLSAGEKSLKFPAEERKPAKASFITAIRTPVDRWFKQPLWYRWGFRTRPVLTLLLANQWRGESAVSSAQFCEYRAAQSLQSPKSGAGPAGRLETGPADS